MPTRPAASHGFARGALALAALALAACATPTPYQPAADGGYGYSETRIEETRLRVTFRGNSVTDREAVENALLYRAADVTLISGYDHFIAADRALDAERRYTSPPRSFSAFGGFYHPYWSYYGRLGWRPWYDPFWDDVTLREVTLYEASIEIVMGRGPKPADNPQAFDAKAVADALAPKVLSAAPG